MLLRYIVLIIYIFLQNYVMKIIEKYSEDMMLFFKTLLVIVSFVLLNYIV